MTLIYCIPLILAAAWSIKYDRQAEFDDNKSHRFWLLYLILSLIAGLSYALGGDKQTYLTEFEDYSSSFLDVFEEIDDGLSDRGQMPGWVVLNLFAKSFFDSFYVVQLIEAFFVNFAIFYTCKRYTQHVFFFLLLYCLTFQYFCLNLEIMREGFSIGFFLLGTETLFRKKYVLTVLLFILAVMFHVSAIVPVLIFPFMRFKITNRRFLFVMLASFLFWFLSNTLFRIIIEAVLGQEGKIFEKILFYSSYSTSIIAFIMYMVMLLVAPFGILYLGMDKGIQDEETLNRKQQFMTFAICLSIVFPSFLTLVRLFNYAMPVFLCITADLMFTLFVEKRHFISKALALFIFWGHTLYQLLAYSPKTGTNYLFCWFPYTSIIDDGTYDRSNREKLHDIILDGEKADENTREVED